MRRDGCIRAEPRHPTPVDMARETGAAGLVTRVDGMRDEGRVPWGSATRVIDSECALPVWLAGHGRVVHLRGPARRRVADGRRGGSRCRRAGRTPAAVPFRDAFAAYESEARQWQPRD